jgi:hypothetical protein
MMVATYFIWIMSEANKSLSKIVGPVDADRRKLANLNNSKINALIWSWMLGGKEWRSEKIKARRNVLPRSCRRIGESCDEDMREELGTADMDTMIRNR